MKDRTYILLAVFFVILTAFFQLYGRYYIGTGSESPVQNVVENPAGEEPVKILLVGDLMLDRTVRTTIDKKGFEYSFTDIKSIFEGMDLAVGNLEGAITSNSSLSQKNFNILKFTFPSSDARALRDLGFSGFSLANNHALDFGHDGYLETITNLGLNDLFYFGSPTNDQNLSSSENIKGQDICFVGYHSLFVESLSPVVDEIKRIKPKCDFIVAFAHWGVEYEDYENKDQEREAYALVDAGADLVVGAHPHVIQPVEVYRGKAIFYSLGNFIFDQDFSLATRQGLAVQMELGGENVTYKFIPIEMYRNKLSFPDQGLFQPRMNVLTYKLSQEEKTKMNESMELILSR